jgi:hypothetical protein
LRKEQLKEQLKEQSSRRLVNLAFVHEVKEGLSGKSLQSLHRAMDPSELWHAAWLLSAATLSFKLDHNRD